MCSALQTTWATAVLIPSQPYPPFRQSHTPPRPRKAAAPAAGQQACCGDWRCARVLCGAREDAGRHCAPGRLRDHRGRPGEQGSRLPRGLVARPPARHPRRVRQPRRPGLGRLAGLAGGQAHPQAEEARLGAGRARRAHGGSGEPALHPGPGGLQRNHRPRGPHSRPPPRPAAPGGHVHREWARKKEGKGGGSVPRDSVGVCSCAFGLQHPLVSAAVSTP